MKDAWLNFLMQLHTWCARDAERPVPAALEEALQRLHEAVTCSPQQFDDTLSQWRQPLGDWWGGDLPPQWDPAWRVLSRQLWTLTAEALTYLEHHRPGAVAAALPRHAAVFNNPPWYPSEALEANDAAVPPDHAMCGT